MADEKPLLIPFEEAGFWHHAEVGMAPDGSRMPYRFAVAAGNAAKNGKNYVYLAGLAAAMIVSSPFRREL